MKSNPVKENHIGSVISEILFYKQTYKDPVTLFKEFMNLSYST